MFELIPSEYTVGERGSIEGEHKWSLPGVVCRVCGNTWRSVGVAYPTVTLSADLLEIQIEPRATMVYPSVPSDVCGACGRLGISRPEEIIVDSLSLPRNVDLFRVINFSTIILATGRFTDAVGKLGLTGVSFAPVRLT